MEPLENQELNDRDLDGLLREWKAPSAPARLRGHVFGGPDRPWWRRIWTASIRIPAPVAVCLAIALVPSAWRWLVPPQARVLIKTERVEVPVVTERVVTRMIYRERPVDESASVPKLRPVTELRPRIIRNRNAEN
jgi:hypothetical protein